MDTSFTKIEQSRRSYQQHGYALIPNFLSAAESAQLLTVVSKFHLAWCKDNQSFYQDRAVNSADLTAKRYLNDEERLCLFKIVSSDSLVKRLAPLFVEGFGFMNTQLFFDPYKPTRKNYWHRDPQWHLSLEQQQTSLAQDTVLHCRIALSPDPGVEVIPGSHRKWDTPSQLDIRLGNNGREVHEDINEGLRLPLQPGDLLIFSGNMIHRGHYGQDRMALDIMFCDNKPQLLQWVNPDCLPQKQMLSHLDNPEVFTTSALFAKRKE